MRTLVILLLLTLAGTMPAAAQAPAAPTPVIWDEVTVTATDGWNLPDCSVRWLEDGSRLRVTRADGTWKDFAPDLVARIGSADGADLTAEVMAAQPGASADHAGQARPAASFNEVGAVSKDEPPRSSLRDRGPKTPLFRLMAGLGAGWGTYSGRWFDGFQEDLSWHGRLRLNAGGNSWFTVGFQRQGGGSIQELIYVDDTIGWLDVSAEVHLNEFQLLAGSAIGRPAPGVSFGYLEVGLVVIQHVASGTVNGYGAGSDSETRLGSQLQLGGLIPLGRATALDIGGSIVAKSSLFSDDESAGLVFGAHVGIAYVDW